MSFKHVGVDTTNALSLKSLFELCGSFISFKKAENYLPPTITCLICCTISKRIARLVPTSFAHCLQSPLILVS